MKVPCRASPGSEDVTSQRQVQASTHAPAEDIVRRRYPAGDAVAFPSKHLEHRVTPVTRGERRS
eukprot:3062115-Lingulodinium_polyedra.AAC.1